MSTRMNSRFAPSRWAVSGMAACLLLVAAPAPASAHANREHGSSCQSGRGKSKARSGRGSRRSRAAQQEAPAPARDTSSDSDLDDDVLGGLDDDSPKPEAGPAPKPEPRPATREAPPRPEEAAEEPSEPTQDDEDDESSEPSAEVEDAPAPEGAANQADQGPSVSIEAFAGVGIATRSVRMPAPTGVLRVAPGVTPSAEVGLRVVAWPQADFSFFVNLVYQSALGFSVTERPPLALPKEVGARSERVALELAPRWRFADGQLEVGVPVGVTVRTLWAEVHMSQTPSFSLVGPHARAELRLRFSELLSLRLAPELQYIMLVDDELTTAGVSSQGVALGAEGSVDAQISQVWSLGVHYRESHALLAAARGSVSFQDVERYLTLRVVGSF